MRWLLRLRASRVNADIDGIPDSPGMDPGPLLAGLAPKLEGLKGIPAPPRRER